jgi:pyruvate dehydrogenase E2 component (dihydrolipoamide acetyltransferase)
MAFEFTMPKLGHLMEEGTVVAWCKKVGDQVTKGDVFLEVDTEKVTLEVEAPEGGILLKILVEAGETVPVGTPLALLGEVGEIV